MPERDPPDRTGEIVDLFARDRAGGQSTGYHRIMGLVSKTDKGAVRATLANILIILAHDPAIAGTLGYNEFTWQPVILRPPPAIEDGGFLMPGPYPRPWGHEDVSLLQAYLQRVWVGKTSPQMAEAAMMVEASSRRFHPVRDWLATLKWDGIHTLDNWLTLAFGCPKDDYHAAVGAKALIAAVRRVRQPGCKFDCMLILEGDQGIGKSTACRTLFSDEWYSDYIVEDLGSKDAALALDGVWGLELAEIQQLIRNEVETVRSFLSRGKDHFRPPYGKSYVDRPRQGVLIGTTNADDYLRDTHGNRRFWPAKCRHADVKWIAEMRSQLWAEAAHREAQGETIFLPPNQITLAATAIQSDRMTDDVWTETVREWLFGRTEVRLPDILTSALNIPRERQGKREEMRVSAILRLDGWERHIGRTDGNAGKATRVWRPKGAATLV